MNALASENEEYQYIYVEERREFIFAKLDLVIKVIKEIIII